MNKLVKKALVSLLVALMVSGGAGLFMDKMEKNSQTSDYPKEDMPLEYNLAEGAAFAGIIVIVFMGFSAFGTMVTRSVVYNRGARAYESVSIYKNNPKGVVEHVNPTTKSPVMQNKRAELIWSTLIPFIIGGVFLIAGLVYTASY